MRKTLEDLYYGNIIPNEQQMTPGSELKRAVDRVAKYEKQLMEQLEEIDQETLTKLIRSQHEINSITANGAVSANTKNTDASCPTAWYTVSTLCSTGRWARRSNSG